MIRILLAPLFGVRQDGATLDMAADLARHLRAHIDVVHVMPAQEGGTSTQRVEPSPAPDRSYGTQAEELLQRDAALRELFENWRSTMGFREPVPLRPRTLASASFHGLSGLPADQLSRRARFADIVCLATPANEGLGIAGETAEAILYGAGRPVLMVPVRERYTPGSLPGNRTVVGWNGSPEAVRAVAAALPFLQVSENVEVITIDENVRRAVDAYELVSYLAFHHIRATAAGIGRQDWSGGDVIDVAVDRGADLLVMGARRHTGTRALGSATRRIFAANPLPVLLAS